MELSVARLVDPRLSEHAAQSRAYYGQRGPRRGPSSLQELQAVRARQSATTPPGSAGVEEVAGAGGRCAVLRVLVPEDGQVQGVHLDIPGGGFYLAPGAAQAARARELVESLGVAVVGVEHRLAPEDPWPAAPDDCEVAALWLLAHAQSRFGTQVMTIGGTSAGATLAMTTLLRLRDLGLADRFAGVVLEYGTYDLSGQTPAGRRIADEYFLQAYLGHVTDRSIADISPIFGDLRGLPPALVVVGAEDVLLEDNLALAVRLSAAGGVVHLRVYPESPHGFTGHPTAMARVALADRNSWLAERLAAAPAARLASGPV